MTGSDGAFELRHSERDRLPGYRLVVNDDLENPDYISSRETVYPSAGETVNLGTIELRLTER